MTSFSKPAFGTVEFDIISQAQRLTLTIYVHYLRVIELGERRSTIRDEMPDDWSHVDAERINDFFDGIEDDGILIAANRLHRWLVRAKAVKLIPDTFAPKFFDLAPAIKEVRDMREHFEEYLMGQGRKPDQFHHFFEFQGGEGLYIGAPTTLSVNGVQYFGGRVNADDLAFAVREVFDEFSQLGLWIHSFTPQKIIAEFKRVVTRGAEQANEPNAV